MAERIVRYTTRYGNTPYPIPLMLGAQDGSDTWRYWSTERTVRDRQEALDVANELLPSSCRAADSSRKLTGKSDPPQVWLVTVGLSEGSDAAELVEILNARFTEYDP